MSENRTVVAFFLGLVIFIVLIGLVINRVKKPKETTEATKTESVTPTNAPNKKGKITPTSKPGLLGSLADLFNPKPTIKPTGKPKSKPIPTVIILGETSDPDRPNDELKQGFAQEGEVSHTASIATKGGMSAQIPSATTIPETGAPTVLISLAFLLGGAGTFLRKRK